MANIEEITSKNTKAEIFEALQEALKREKELSIEKGVNLLYF